MRTTLAAAVATGVSCGSSGSGGGRESPRAAAITGSRSNRWSASISTPAGSRSTIGGSSAERCTMWRMPSAGWWSAATASIQTASRPSSDPVIRPPARSKGASGLVCTALRMRFARGVAAACSSSPHTMAPTRAAIGFQGERSPPESSAGASHEPMIAPMAKPISATA